MLLDGMIEVDGGYFGGKPYKSNLRRKKNAEAIQNKVAGKKPTQRLTKQDIKNIEKRKLRRVVIAIREIGHLPGQGAVKTRFFVTLSENEQDVTHMILSHVKRGSIISTDECPAYNGLSAFYEHRVVRHSKEFCNIDGINENQCESAFSRIRRAEIGVHHNMRREYLQIKMSEFAWKEDHRRTNALEKISGLFCRLCKAGRSSFKGYFQRKDKKAIELLWKNFIHSQNDLYGTMLPVR